MRRVHPLLIPCVAILNNPAQIKDRVLGFVGPAATATVACRDEGDDYGAEGSALQLLQLSHIPVAEGTATTPAMARELIMVLESACLAQDDGAATLRAPTGVNMEVADALTSAWEAGMVDVVATVAAIRQLLCHGALPFPVLVDQGVSADAATSAAVKARVALRAILASVVVKRVLPVARRSVVLQPVPDALMAGVMAAFQHALHLVTMFDDVAVRFVLLSVGLDRADIHACRFFVCPRAAC